MHIESGAAWKFFIIHVPNTRRAYFAPWLTGVVGQVQILIHFGFHHRDLPSNNMLISDISLVRENYFLNNRHCPRINIYKLFLFKMHVNTSMFFSTFTWNFVTSCLFSWLYISSKWWCLIKNLLLLSKACKTKNGRVASLFCLKSFWWRSVW